MAAFETTRLPVAGLSFGGRLSGSLRTAFDRVVAWNSARVTRIRLSQLTDRELDDIGLCRGDIHTIR